MENEKTQNPHCPSGKLAQRINFKVSDPLLPFQGEGLGMRVLV